MRPLVIAHRGASAEKSENTLSAFRRALALGVDGVELDARVTADGVAVVFHDETLWRLTRRRGRIATKSWAELAALRIGGRERVPSLQEVLVLFRGRATVQIEIKAGEPIAPILAAVRNAEAESGVILASFALGIVRDLRAVAPDLPRMIIAEAKVPLGRLLRDAEALGACGVSVDHRALRGAADVRAVQARNLQLWTWTVNTSRRMRTLAGWGVTAILSDDPARLQRALEVEA